MKYIIICLLSLAVLSNGAVSQTISRNTGETADQFATRFAPEKSEVVHKVIDTKWNNRPVLIAFYKQTYVLPATSDPDHQEYGRIVATMFVQVEANKYQSYLIDTIDTEGGDPTISSVLFANADADKARELVIMITWPVQHYDVLGTLYGTRVYDDMGRSTPTVLRYMEPIST